MEADVRLPATVVEECTVRPGQPAGLVHRSTEETAADWLGPGGLPAARHLADHDLESFRRRLADAQQRLWASGTWAVEDPAHDHPQATPRRPGAGRRPHGM